MHKAKYPTIEIVSFQDSEAVLKDESFLNTVFDAVIQSQGYQHVYTGKCVDDGETNTRFILVAWDGHEDHVRLMEDPIVYPKLLEVFHQCYVKEFTMFHIPASGDVTTVFTAPITEITMVQAKNQCNGPELQQLFTNWAEASRNAALAKEYQPFVFGQTLENVDVYFMISGWATKDHYLKCIDTDLKTEVEGLVDQTKEMIVKHCILKEYTALRGQ